MTAALPLAGLWPVRALCEQQPQVVCTLPTICAIAREIGGGRFEYISLAKGDQDPHFVSPVPSLMSKTRQAALLLEIGMQLEIWADQVADGSGNPRIFRGAPGRAQVSLGIPVEEIPPVITRAEGDLHPQGNPHLWLDPLRAKILAANIAKALQRAAPEHEREIEAALGDFRRRIDESLFGTRLLEAVGTEKLTRLAFDGALWEFLDAHEVGGEKLASMAGGWLAKARGMSGTRVVEYHKVWVYFCKTFGLELVGTIEEKPGIPPGPRHQREITERIRNQNVKLILVDNFYDPSLPQKIAGDTGARVVILPNQVGGEPGVEDYFSLIDHLVERITGALGERQP
jgi:ABC-type Zn uptake system ZnuABC Zn-binding protein ZnuA